MRLQDPTFTGKLAKDMGEQEFTSLIRSFEEKAGITDTKRPVDSRSVSIERMERVTFRDLQSQMVGQATIIAEGRIVRMNAFYCEPLSCVPTHRMNSYIRRFASWRAPLWTEISLVQTVRDQAQKNIVSASPLPSQPILTDLKMTLGTAALSQNLKIAASRMSTAEETIEAARPTNPLFGGVSTPSDSHDVPLSGLQPSLPQAAAGPSAGTDLYSKFIGGLHASQPSRIEYEQTARSFLALQLEKPGPVSLWDEFMNMSFVGIDLCAEPTATMDMATMTIGLIGLAGIRGRFRRDGKLPPYLPLSWTAKKALDNDLRDSDWADVLGADVPQGDDFFAQFGAPLSDDDAPPEPTYMASARRHDFDDHGLPLDDPDGEDEEGTDGMGDGSIQPLADEIMKLLDQDD
jgi:hypothetical protein